MTLAESGVTCPDGEAEEEFVLDLQEGVERMRQRDRPQLPSPVL